MQGGLFQRFSSAVAVGAGRPAAFLVAVGLIVAWAASAPLFGFSTTWQLVVNTVTTIVTFLMVFVLQHSQNRDSEALQAKLDDLIVAVSRADNRLVGAEKLSSHELHALRRAIEREVRASEATIEVDPAGTGVAAMADRPG